MNIDEIVIFENTPYRLDKNLVKAYNSFMELLPDGSWGLFRDADTLFLDSMYGEVLVRAIKNNPTTGCFTCLTNRINNPQQLHSEYSGDGIRKHRAISNVIKKKNANQYKNIIYDDSNPTGIISMSGMMLLLSKDAWNIVGGFKPSTLRTDNRNTLGVDNQLHLDLHINNIPVKLISEMYIYHWYRGGNKNSDRHLR